MEAVGAEKIYCGAEKGSQAAEKLATEPRRTSGAKAPFRKPNVCGTAEAVPLSKTDFSAARRDFSLARRDFSAACEAAMR
jgi:hypothetical protein